MYSLSHRPTPPTGLQPITRLCILIWEYGSFDMDTLMKTTIEVSDALLEAAKRLAKERGTTLRAVMEEALRAVVETEPSDFRLRDASVPGEGLHPEVQAGGWERISELAYRGRGG